MTDKQLIELNKIHGNEYLNRSVKIALMGRHTITVIGNPDNGLEHIEKVFADTGGERNSWLFQFITPCPCYNFRDNLLICSCSMEDIINHRKTGEYQQALKSDIIVRLLTPMFSDYPFKNFDQTVIDLLRTAHNRFNFTLKQMNKVLSIAKTIAYDDNSESVLVHHIAEAIQYQISDTI